ncbi:hypothetical protein CsatA_012030 [Cannabis sativa]
MWLLLLTFLLPLLFLIQKKLKAKQYNTSSQLPPSPSKLPIIGNILQLGSTPHQSLWKLSKTYGDVMLLRFGRLQTIVVSSAEAAKEVLKVHDLECCSRPSLAGLARLSYNNHDISFSPYGEHWRQIHELDEFYNQVIDEHLKRTPEEGKEDIVDWLLCIERSENEHEHFQFTRVCTKAVLKDIFITGVDTGAVTISWAMRELHQLEYLKMVIKETLRLHPPAPLLLPRESISHFMLANYEISPKTLIQVNVWAIGRDPRYWQNPEEFFPERFSDSSIDYKGQHFELLPFGAGRRGCPGIYTTMTMVELTLANLLNCFYWKLPNGMRESDIDMEEGSWLTAHKNSALKLVPVTYHCPSNNEI